tara:strand:+ start:435 stop:575 length:141 start_codon:yes stop_codon:yes gene_type:complete
VHVEINGDDNADDSTVSTRNDIFDVIFGERHRAKIQEQEESGRRNE